MVKLAPGASRVPQDDTPPKGSRLVIEGVTPQVDGGRFPAKGSLGEQVVVEADVLLEGHDRPAVLLLHRALNEQAWTEVRMRPIGNDRFRAEFAPSELGSHFFSVEAWIDHFATWAGDLSKRVAASQDVAVDLLIGAEIVEAATKRAKGPAGTRLKRFARDIRSGAVPGGDQAMAARAALSSELQTAMEVAPDRAESTRMPRELELWVDRERARYSTWYELFPRSTGPAGVHGTFADLEKRLRYVARMGFDVLYLPPIHPIGRRFRKGPNNSVDALPGEPGSSWAIGGPEGGHKSVNPLLGTLESFHHLLGAASAQGLEVALDLAFQCSPDHPYLAEHPEWFRRRPDGTIQYAENPPKKYQDIYPFDFETGAWRELWAELRSIVDFWIEQGVRIFRVDNPHTKPFRFWEWLISGVRAKHPEVVFLAEAFTRPKVMQHLAKLGFTQSYTYFAWRSTAAGLEEYFTELGRPPVSDFFRPNLWPNTPDILTDELQVGGRGAFVARLVLAATLGASYGIYGPAFELMENVAVAPGKEEYRDSEKYQLRHWDLARPDSLSELIARVNRIRARNPALQTDRGLRFIPTDNDQLLAYSKVTADGTNLVLTVVNLDPRRTQRGFVDIPTVELNLPPTDPFQVHDLLTDARYSWRGGRNYVELDPGVVPAHVLQVLHPALTEHG